MLGKQRATVTKDNIKWWFGELRKYLVEENAEDILDDPSQMYNADESGFPLAPKSAKVLA